jgi:N-acyl-D-amino-acid deacylase
MMLISRFAADPSLIGKTIAEIAKERGKSPTQTYLDLINLSIAKKADEFVIGTSMDTQDIYALTKWPNANVSSDGALHDRHPRGAGSFTKVLREMVREAKVMTLPEAISHMTSLSAKHMGIKNRGQIKRGQAADIFLFDPATVSDHATTKAPEALSTGIDRVWVNGEIVWQDGKSTGTYSGQVIVRQSK